MSPSDLPRGETNCAQFIAPTAQKRGHKRILLFVHGYRTTFESAVRGGLALAQNIEYPGLVVVWSWPSDGWSLSYPFDEETAEWAEAHLEPFEHALNSLAPDLQIAVLAHSLGNRMALFMLERARTNIDHFCSVVFAAPDVARDIFLQALNRIGTVAQLQTLYGSNSDKAMSTSTYFHSSHGQSIPRAGGGGQDILISGLIESVDVTEVAQGGIGHSYVFDNPRVTIDLKGAVVSGTHADRRGLHPKHIRDQLYWSIER